MWNVFQDMTYQSSMDAKEIVCSNQPEVNTST
jgi:hypothetical protein